MPSFCVGLLTVSTALEQIKGSQLYVCIQFAVQLACIELFKVKVTKTK